MSSTLVEIADAVVVELNQSSLQDAMGKTFEAKRTYLPEVTLEDADKALHVLVAISALATSNFSRNSTLKEPIVQIGFLTRMASDFTNDWMDELVLAMEVCADHFRRTKFTMDAGDRTICVKADIPLVYDYASFRENKEFRSYIQLHYRRET